MLRGFHHYFLGSAEDNVQARTAFQSAARLCPQAAQPGRAFSLHSLHGLQLRLEWKPGEKLPQSSCHGGVTAQEVSERSRAARARAGTQRSRNLQDHGGHGLVRDGRSGRGAPCFGQRGTPLSKVLCSSGRLAAVQAQLGDIVSLAPTFGGVLGQRAHGPECGFVLLRKFSASIRPTEHVAASRSRANASPKTCR